MQPSEKRLPSTNNIGIKKCGVATINTDKMNMKKFTIILFAVFTLNIAKAQMTTYTTANSGLVDNNISTIAIDAQDNKWFGTGGGVSMFDGINWTTYTEANSGLVSNAVYTIAIDAQGNKWFGTWGGVSKFDGTNWTTYTTVNSGLVENYVSAIAIDIQGNKWFGTNSGGVSKFDGTNWTTYTTANGLVSNQWVTAITIDVHGNKWFGTNGGVSKFDSTNWTTYLNGEIVGSIAIDALGYKWFGTYDPMYNVCHGTFKFDSTNWTTFDTLNSGLTNNYVNDIGIDALGNKWFGTQGGVSTFNDTIWTTYTIADGLVSNGIYTIAIDAQGNKWFGTYYGVSELSHCGIPPLENICYIEFDTTTSKNSINWTTNLPVNVDSIKIYNEVSTNVWSLIGSVSSNQNHFIDLNSNPFNQSYSYKITTIDTCGNESDSSSFHTTITLLSTYDQGTNTYGFTWSAYQGLTISNYYLYGITNSGAETLIGSVPGNQYFYNYTNPSPTFTKYFVGFNTPTCTSKTNHLVKSNWGQSATGINESVGIDNLITLYPNPASDMVTLNIDNINNADLTLNIYNVIGTLVKSETLKQNNRQINISDLCNGVYLITIKSKDLTENQRLIIQR